MRAGAVAVLAALVAFIASAGSASTPAIEGRFTLTTLDGRTVTNLDYRGKWLLVYFGYTSCPDVCPATLTELGQALKELGPAAKRVQALFITVDPMRDTAPVLRRYLKAFDPRIVGLRGDGDATEAAAKSFHVYYRARSIGGGQYAIDHSSYIYVFDQKGQFVQLLAPDSPGHRIAEDIKRLVH
ncbi:MAG TPA: SCO family protein [Rhizomicrobium sp.]|jgi:protein SCO1/2